MWKCPTCGEEIEEQFDACWKCAKADVSPPGTERRAQQGGAGLFFCYWRRGWSILLMVFCVGLFRRGASYLLSSLFKGDQTIVRAGVVGLLLLLMPPFAYWLFVLFFGEEAWPRRSEAEFPREERAYALLEEAARLESRGRVQEAIAKYETVVGSFGDTPASRDAQISVKNLRARIG